MEVNQVTMEVNHVSNSPNIRTARDNDVAQFLDVIWTMRCVNIPESGGRTDNDAHLDEHSHTHCTDGGKNANRKFQQKESQKPKGLNTRKHQ